MQMNITKHSHFSRNGSILIKLFSQNVINLNVVNSKIVFLKIHQVLSIYIINEKLKLHRFFSKLLRGRGDNSS